MSIEPVLSANDLLRARLDQAVRENLLSDSEPEDSVKSRDRKRAWRDPRAGSRLASVALVQDNDVLRWVYAPPPTSSRRRGRRAVSGAEGEVIHGFQFLEVPPNRSCPDSRPSLG